MMRTEKEENDFFSTIRLIDHDLSLHFIKKAVVSPPDTSVFAYHFTMSHTESGDVMGQVNIKAGYTDNIVKYRGNIGYAVYDKYRGNHYASRSCILLVPVLKFLGLNPVYITCNPDNRASMKSIEALGTEFLGTESIPESSPYYSYYPKDSKAKLRYQWVIQ